MIRWKLNEMMADRRVTGKELADRLGYTEATISRLRKSRRMPRLTEKTLEGVCLHLKCTPADLLILVNEENS